MRYREILTSVSIVRLFHRHHKRKINAEKNLCINILLQLCCSNTLYKLQLKFEKLLSHDTRSLPKSKLESVIN